MIISRTPFRLSFFGGGTDYPAWYRNHGGAVLAVTIDKYCYLTCRYLPPFFEHRIRVVWSRIESCQSVDEVTHPAVREVLRFLQFDRGVEIHHDGDLPARSGMGSSSAFTVGLLHALHALEGRMPSKLQLARESIHVEQDRLAETVGSQDQVLAAYGGLSHVTFLPNDEAECEGADDRSSPAPGPLPIAVRPVTLPGARVQELASHLMLFYTGIKRTASDVARSYVARIEDRARELCLMRELVDESLTILSGAREITDFGVLLREAWEIKRRLSASVSNARVDAIYQSAREAGAIGGKLAGAGGGGFLLLFVPPCRQPEVLEALRDLVYVPFRFESQGSQIIFCDPQEDYSALEARRARQSPRLFEELCSEETLPR